jgi:hypothetical protein
LLQELCLHLYVNQLLPSSLPHLQVLLHHHQQQQHSLVGACPAAAAPMPC